MKIFFLALAVFFIESAAHTSMLLDPHDETTHWNVKFSSGVTIKRNPNSITYEYPDPISPEKIHNMEAKEILFSQNEPRPGTFPLQDITITTLMSYKQFYCAVVNLYGGFVDKRHPLYAMSIGMLYGTTFEFENGNTVTIAHEFCAYETKHIPKKEGPDFENYAKQIQLGPLVRPFKQIVKPYSWNVLASPVVRFMGFAPLQDGVIDTSMKLDSFRAELAKLGPIKSETRDPIPLDKKYPKAFNNWYRFLEANFDDLMRPKSFATIIP